jgi:nitrous oxidase accessory protein NosD
VDAAKAGDTVLVAPGTYFETVRLKSGIRLLGSGATWTHLDGAGAPVRLIDFSGATDVVVAGFTFQNVGTGNRCDGMDVTSCAGVWYSSAIFADGHTEQQAPSSALLMHNVFRNNPVGVLLYFHARAVVRNNIFVGNTHGFVANHFQDVALVANNVFWENTREAIVSQAAYLDIINNVVARSEVGILH